MMHSAIKYSTLTLLLALFVKGSTAVNGNIEFPTSWKGTSLAFTIPKNFPTREPIFSIQVLTPPPLYSEEYTADMCQGSQTSCTIKRCRENSRKKRELEDQRRKRRRRESRDKKLFGGLEKTQRRKGRPESGRRRFHSNVRNLEREEWKEENQSGKERTKDNKRKKEKRASSDSFRFRLAKDQTDLFLLNFDYSTGLLALYLSRRLRAEDYMRNQRDAYVEVMIQVKDKDECPVDLGLGPGSGSPSKDTNSKNKTKDWRNIYLVRIHVSQPFKCERPHESMCLLPEGNLTLHQWENREEGSLLVLPSLSGLCPNLRREMNISMHGIKRTSMAELMYSDTRGFHVPALDREKRGSLLPFDYKCTIKNKKGGDERWRHSSGFLYVEDEDDSLPIRLSQRQHVVLNVTEIDRNFTKLPYFVDPDLFTGEEFKVRISKEAEDIFSLHRLLNFPLRPDNCFKFTRNFPRPLRAECTILHPILIYKGKKGTKLDRFFNFSVELADVKLVHNPHGNKVWYNVTINILNDTKDLNNSLDPSTITNISIPYPASKFARLAQAIQSIPESSIKKLQGQKFSLSNESRDKGLDITPNLGILYIAKPDLLINNLTRESSIEFVVHRGNNFTKRFSVNWSGDQYSCDHKLPSPPYVTTGGKYPNACSNHDEQKTCESSCGIGSLHGKCSWRSNKFNFPSEEYATCSPNLSTCPDGICDELEMLNNKICLQDCVVENKTKGHTIMNTKVVPPRGILSGMGVCTCDDFCQCFPVNNVSLAHEEEESHRYAVDREPMEEKCGTACRIVIGFGVVVGFFIVLAVFCRKRKDCGGKFKEGSLAGIPYLSDVEEHSSSYTPQPQHGEPHAMVLYSVNQHDSRGANNNNNNNQLGMNLPLPNFPIDRKWEFPRNQLVLEQTLGEGEFGKVMKAKALSISGTTGYSYVAVKMLKNNSTASELADLLSEYDLLKEVNHPNVIKLLGACTTKDGPIFLIIEYCKYGSLRTFLRRCRHFEFESQVGSAPLEDLDYKIVPKDLLSFAWQICKGMAYLSNMKLVHRDLAARNVLLAYEKVCKISDFGLTRDVYEDDLYFKHSKGKVPVKWMALESLVDHVYTSKSDVWSFGVLLWELVTLGSSPYPGIAPERLYYLLKSGYRMERPENSSEDLYRVMRACWTEDANKRISFIELMNIFERMIQEDVEYLELRTLIVTNRVYFDDRAAEAESANASSILRDSSSQGLPERSPKNSSVKLDETKIDQDSYLLAHSQGSHLPTRQDLTAPFLPALPPISGVNITCHGTNLHAHNLAYSPVTGGSEVDVFQPIPPPLQYSTLESGPDEEEMELNVEENQDGPTEGDSDSGRATGDSGYLTEEGKKNHSRVPSGNHPSILTSNRRISKDSSYTQLIPLRGTEPPNNVRELDERQELLDDIKISQNDLLIIPSKEKKRVNGVSLNERTANLNSNDKRNPVVV